VSAIRRAPPGFPSASLENVPLQSLWMLFAGLCFALMGVFVNEGSAQFSAAELVFYRALVQMIMAWAVLRRAGLSVRTERLGMHVHRGVAGFVSLFMFFYALTTLPVATAMTLNYMSPLWLALLLTWIARERPGAGLLATIVLGFAGCLMLLRPTLSADQVWPALVGLISGAISAVAYWNVRRLVQLREPEARVVFYFALFACLGSLVWMAPQSWHPVTWGNFWLLAGVGVFGGMGQLAMTRAYGKGRALVTAALSYSGIVFSALLGLAIGHTPLPALAWMGIALIILAGIIAVQLQPGARKEPASQVTND
jgi:S-adenosylmethionine uptake transporter